MDMGGYSDLLTEIDSEKENVARFHRCPLRKYQSKTIRLGRVGGIAPEGRRDAERRKSRGDETTPQWPAAWSLDGRSRGRQGRGGALRSSGLKSNALVRQLECASPRGREDGGVTIVPCCGARGCRYGFARGGLSGRRRKRAAEKLGLQAELRRVSTLNPYTTPLTNPKRQRR